MRRHVPWIQTISQYLGYLTLIYRKREENDSDALSRRSDLMDLTEESIENHPELKRKFEEYDAGVFEREIDEILVSMSEMTHLQVDNDLIQSIVNGYKLDKAFTNKQPPGTVLDTNTGLYWISDKIYIPYISSIKNNIIDEFHTTNGHADYNKTADCIRRSFYWPSLVRDTKSFIKLCVTCQKVKVRTSKPYGSSMPLPVPKSEITVGNDINGFRNSFTRV